MKQNNLNRVIADQLCSPECDYLWHSVFEDASPGHYGIHDLEVHALPENISVEETNQSFRFFNVGIDISVRLGASSKRDGIDVSSSFTVSGTGNFNYDSEKVAINELSVNEHLDFFEEDKDSNSGRTMKAVIGGAIIGASLGGSAGTFIGALTGAFLAQSTKPNRTKKGQRNG